MRRVVFLLLLLLAIVAAGFAWKMVRLEDHSIPWGVPDRPVKVAAWNVLSLERGEIDVIELLREQNADVIMLSEVQETQVERLRNAMQREAI